MASLVKRCRHKRPEWDSCGCTWYVRAKVGGRDTYANVGADRAAAERALARVQRRREETMSEAVDVWLAAKAREPGARPGSLASWRARARHVKSFFGAQPVRAVRPEHLSRFAADLLEEGYAPATVQGIYAALTSTLRHAQRRGVIVGLPLPLEGPGIPAPRPRVQGLTLAQVEQVISEMPGVWGRVAELVLLTGLRWGEAVALEEADVAGDVLHVRRTLTRAGTVNAPKTRAGARAVPLSPRARVILDGLDLPVGGDYRRARDALVAAMGDLHRPGMGWHTIRNAHASLLDAAGVSLRESAARMGHGHSYAQTLAYGLATEAGEAAALDRVRAAVGAPSAERGRVVQLGAARARRAGPRAP